VRLERTVKRDLPGSVNSVHLLEMHLIRRHQADPGMVVILVLPIEEPAAEAPGILNVPEPLRKSGRLARRRCGKRHVVSATVEDAIARHNVPQGQLTLHADRCAPMKAKATAFLLADLLILDISTVGS
jgi:hypothetical protein